MCPIDSMKKQLNYESQGRRSVFCIGKANKQAPETLTCRGFWGNSPLEILKVGNATFSILDEISEMK